MKLPADLVAVGSSPQRSIGRLFAQHGSTSVLVVCSASQPGALGFAEEAVAAIGPGGMLHTHRSGAGNEGSVNELVKALANHRPDTVVSVGGGSTHDMVKVAIALQATGQTIAEIASTFEAPDFWQFPRLAGSFPVIFTVPTTFSGSEANGNAGYSVEGEKKIISSDSLMPRAVLLSPRLYRSTPSQVLVGSLFNAVSHCLEAECSPRQGILTRHAVIAGCSMLGEALMQRPEDWSDELLMRLGTASALIALGQAGTTLGLAHSIGHVFGAAHGIEHGAAHAMAAPAVARFNADHCGESYERLGAAFALGSGSEVVGRLPEWLAERAFFHFGHLSLSRFGIDRSDLDGIVHAVTREPGYYFNPRPAVPQSELRALIEEML